MSAPATLLVIDTALDAQSLALLAGDTVLAAHHDVIGRGHAEALLPAIAALLARAGVARPDAIAVDIGPGSFTGLRIGIAAARALGLAWEVPVGGYASLALIAAPWFAADADLAALTAVAATGRATLYVQTLRRDLTASALPVALDPAAAAAMLDPLVPLAGPGAARIAAHCHFAVLGDDWPAARDVRLLPLAARTLPPVPHYVGGQGAAA